MYSLILETQYLPGEDEEGPDGPFATFCKTHNISYKVLAEPSGELMGEGMTVIWFAPERQILANMYKEFWTTGDDETDAESISSIKMVAEQKSKHRSPHRESAFSDDE